jgi:hypothetical protein
VSRQGRGSDKTVALDRALSKVIEILEPRAEELHDVVEPTEEEEAEMQVFNATLTQFSNMRDRLESEPLAEVRELVREAIRDALRGAPPTFWWRGVEFRGKRNSSIDDKWIGKFGSLLFRVEYEKTGTDIWCVSVETDFGGYSTFTPTRGFKRDQTIERSVFRFMTNDLEPSFEELGKELEYSDDLCKTRDYSAIQVAMNQCTELLSRSN